MEWCAEPRQKSCTCTTNFNLRWPAPFIINDLHPWFRGGRTVSERVCPPPQVAEEREEDEEEEMSHLLQHATTLRSSLRLLLCGKQTGGENLICLSLYESVHAQLSFQYVCVIASLCWCVGMVACVCAYTCMCLQACLCVTLPLYIYALCFCLCCKDLCIYVIDCNYGEY